MSRRLTPSSTLENLKREAKRWLRALRNGDTAARARFERIHPKPPAEPGLRDVQYALALEFAFDGWSELRTHVTRIEAGQSGNARELAISQLLEAAASGDLARVSELLDAHPDIIDERAVIPGHSGRRTALHHAVAHADIVEHLLGRGADPNIRDEGDNAMPLHFAAEREDLDVIRLLIEHGADPIGAGNHHQLEVIGWAACFGSARPDVIAYLLAHGARHTIVSAVATGDADAIRKLADELPACVDQPMDRTNLRRRPLHFAVVRRQPDALAALLDAGADTEAVDASGLTALDQAALNGEATMVRMLIDRGARLNLPAAIALEDEGAIERLLLEDPDSLKPGHRFATLLVRASERASGQVIRALIRAGANVNVTDDPETSVDQVERYAPLHAAAFHGNADAVTVLLEHHANPNVRDGRYCSAPAGWAAYAGHIAVRDQILAGQVDPFQVIDHDRADRIPDIVLRSPWMIDRPFREYAECTDAAGRGVPRPAHVPLHWAIIRNRIDAVRALLENGAAPILDPDGRTPADLARAEGHHDVAALIADNGRLEQTHRGRVRLFMTNACPDHGIRGPAAHHVARHAAARLLEHDPAIATDSIYTAVVCGDIEEVRHILAREPGAATQRSSSKGWEPLLHLCFTRLPSVPAATDHAIAIARLLIEHGGDPNAFFMAGDSRYTPLVGVIGEGEEDRPAHPRRDELVDLLLESGAEPFDIQVLYNIHFHGDALWFLERIHAGSVRRGRRSAWEDPDWPMLDMGGYGCGARYLLEMAIQHDNRRLVEWLLEHGANPQAPPPPHPRRPKRSLHEEAIRRGRTALADLLVRYGATPSGAAADDEDVFVAACLASDEERVRAMTRQHPEFLESPKAMHAAAKANRPDVVAFLLDAGCSIEIENADRQRPLHVAAWSDAVECARLLVERGAEIDPVESSWNNTPLDFAVYGQLPRMIAFLGPHSRNVWNLVFTGHVDRLRELLRASPTLARTTSRAGGTPLMWLPDDERAATEIVRLFLANGADAGARDARGRTAADHASRRGLFDVAGLLRSAEPLPR